MEFLDLLQSAFDNRAFRRVIATGEHCQLILMCVRPGEGLEDEHLENDKIFLVLAGQAEFTFSRDSGAAKEGNCILVAEGTKYKLISTGEKDLKMVVVYGPSEFADGIVQDTAADAIFDESPG